MAARSGDLAMCHVNGDMVSNGPDLLSPKAFFERPSNDRRLSRGAHAPILDDQGAHAPVRRRLQPLVRPRGGWMLRSSGSNQVSL